MSSTEHVRVLMDGTKRTVARLARVDTTGAVVDTVAVSNQRKPERSVTRKKERKPVLRDTEVRIVSYRVIRFGTAKNAFQSALVSKGTHRSATLKKVFVYASRVSVAQSKFPIY